MPEISVIIPIYNEEKYLPQCLDSVLNQTLTDIEVICIDDGSTDNSGKILQQYAAKDNRIKYVTQENIGLSTTRNTALQMATANYISFIDSDDFVHPRFLETLYRTLQETGCDVSGCNFVKVYHNEKIPPYKPIKPKIYTAALPALLNHRNFIHFNVWNKLYKREVLDNMRFVDGIYYEDWVFNTCLFSQIKSFAFINSPLYAYRISENSIMRSQYSLKKLHDYTAGIKEVYNFIGNNFPNQWKKVKQTRIARTSKMMMNNALRSKNPQIMAHTKQTLQELYAHKIIGYKGLSLHNKIKLFFFLH